MNTARTVRQDPERTDEQSVARIGPNDAQERKATAARSVSRPPNRLLAFIEELRRRKVCRALTVYAVALWVISQVVDLAYQQLGLPDWTLQFVIIVGLAGLPIALLASWLLDLTPDGLVRDSCTAGAAPPPARQRHGERTIDCVLLFAALAIAASLVYANVGRPPTADVPRYERIAVTPFEAGTGDDAPALSKGLTTELQHELANRANFRVVAPRTPYAAKNCLTLTGSVSTDAAHVRITAALIDNESMEVVWSEVILKDRTNALMTVADIARDVVSVLRLPNGATAHQEVRRGS